MLVLTRKVGEKVLVGENISVTVVRIGPNAVRLGIEAPKETNIAREELVAHPIQVREADIADLGQRMFDPLDVAEAYEDLDLK